MKPGLKTMALTALVSLNLTLAPGVAPQEAQQQQPSSLPDGPAPQPQQVPLTSLTGPIKPGGGAGTESNGSSSSSGSPNQPPAPEQPPPPARDEIQTTPPEVPPAGEGFDKTQTVIRLNVNFVEVPVTVKDSKGGLVAGLTFRDFQVYENEQREPLRLFTVDPFPLSIAFLVDQSVTADVMTKVNDSLGAIQGALTPYDEVAVFTYNNGAQNRSGGFTGAQSTRVPYVLAMTKAAGAEMLVPINSGPLAGCSITKNGSCVDPNVQQGRSTGNSTFMTIPKEIHTLNDGILAAAKELSTRPKGRRRVIYVISDGKENGSKASYRDVLRYLQTNHIAVYGTLVGDSARWGEGYLSRVHLPFTMYNNLLAKYTLATGGTLDAERGTNGIERSYAKIAEEARNQYTLGYLSHQPVIDGKFRKIEVRVNRPNVEVVAKSGYYPSAEDLK
ncbi:MAG TPA: VWA domain-containing protein [Terracidiphilus sp.]|nr:VWA domain-containing protein [Terracidiphilus sp.]